MLDPKNETVEPVTVAFTKAQRQWLEGEAKKQDRSVSYLVRQYIDLVRKAGAEA